MKPSRHPSYFRWAAGAAIVISLAGLGLFAWTMLHELRAGLLADGRTSDPAPIELVIGGQRLAVPGNTIRFEAARKPGKADRVDLLLLWPELDGLTAANAKQFHDHDSATVLVYATIRPSDDSGDTTSRLDGVYTRFFGDDAWAGPNGLVGVRLDEKSGYGGEELFFQPESDHPYVARCLADRQDGIPSSCMREIKLANNLSVTLRFDRALLAEWQDFDATVIKRVEGFVAR